MENNVVDAILFLKNGSRKYGKLIGDEQNGAYRFIDNQGSREEIIPVITINAIETDLK